MWACIACQTASALTADWQALKRRSSHCRGDATSRRVGGQDAVPWRSPSSDRHPGCYASIRYPPPGAATGHWRGLRQ